MSILQKILEDMFVEPELLAELDDEQKQILFCKMREEQVRRWEAYERDLQAKERLNPAKNSNGRKVEFLKGSDGEPWVWVMGEHAADKPIEDILEEEAHHKARRLAEQEADRLRRKEEEELKEKLRIEQEESEREKRVLAALAAAGPLVAPPPPSTPSATPAGPDSAPQPPPKADESEAWKLYQQIKETKAVPETPMEKSAPPPNQPVRNTRLKEAAQERMQKEIEEQRKREEEINEERDRLAARLKAEAERRIAEEKEKRESEIYLSLKEARIQTEKEAEAQQKQTEQAWIEQERKAKQAEEQIREIARRAREQHRTHSLRTSSSLLTAIHDLNTHSRTQSLKLPRPNKPESRKAIVEWFLREERPQGAGMDPTRKEVAPWFHGIIPRRDAELMIEGCERGRFLVRVSERIWGYALSYQTGQIDKKVKHFLIERIPAGYQFLGTNQIVHKTLWDLVSYHQKVPITPTEKELLIRCAGQTKNPPDYHELFTSNLYTSDC